MSVKGTVTRLLEDAELWETLKRLRDKLVDSGLEPDAVSGALFRMLMGAYEEASPQPEAQEYGPRAVPPWARSDS